MHVDLIQQAYDAVDCGLVVLDSEYRVVSANRAVATLLNCDPQRITGHPVEELFGPTYDHVDWMLPVVARSGQPKRVTISMPCGEKGEIRFLAIHVSILEEKGGELYLVMSLSDMSEQYQQMVSGAQTEKMAAVGLLAAGIAHEFNNIWASVQGYAELAKDNADFNRELVDVCLEQSDRASTIIHSLLSFSDIRVDLNKGVRLGRILGSIRRLVNMEMQAKGIELEIEIDQDPVLAGNESMLQQILLNLVINAYQAIEGKGRVHIWLGQLGQDVVLRVRDSGVGMTKEQQRRLFEPFFTTKGAMGGNEKVDGHGLGLTLTYNLIQLHGGQIAVQSEPGKGSVFTLRIPIHEVQESGEAEPETESAPEKGGPEGLRILVVDDEVILQHLIRSALPRHTVDAVGAGEDAVDAMAEVKYDLVFLDLVLAGAMDGLEVFDWMLEHTPETKVAVLTGRPEHESLVPYLEKAAGLIHKPFSLREIDRILAAAFAATS